MKTRPSLTTTILSSSKYTQAASGGLALCVFSNLEKQFYIPTLQMPFAQLLSHSLCITYRSSQFVCCFELILQIWQLLDWTGIFTIHIRRLTPV